MSVAQRDVAAAVLAISGLWVTKMMVRPSACSFWNSTRISKEVRVSRLPVASSARITAGLFTKRGRWLRVASDRRTSDWTYVPVGRPAPRLAGLRWHVSAFRKPRRRSYTSAVAPHFPRQCFGQQVVTLEYEADFTVAQYGALRLAHGAYGDTVQQVFAAGGRVQAAEYSASRLSGARCTHDGDKLAFTDGERDAAQACTVSSPTWKLRLIF
mgnify:CR=1 FL=1